MEGLDMKDYYLQTIEIKANNSLSFDYKLNKFLKSLGDSRLVVKVHDLQKDTINQYTTVEYLVKK